MIKINPSLVNKALNYKGYFIVPRERVFNTENKNTLISDSFEIPEQVNKSVMVEKGLIRENESTSDFFNKISTKILGNNRYGKNLAFMLKMGAVSFSSSIYSTLVGRTKDPTSAYGVQLDPKKNKVQTLANLEGYIKNEKGVGINFSNFENPVETLREINSYFKYRENEHDTKRPPAGIALLDIYHPKILDFIKMKDNDSYKDWCFDLSVIMPSNFLKKVDNNEDIVFSDGKVIKAVTLYNNLLLSMYKKGEPGIIFSDNPNYICDCCATAPLKKDEGLTLAHINLSKFYNPSTKDVNIENIKFSAGILAKAMQKIDPNGYIGVVGYQDLLNKLEINYGSYNANKLEEAIFKALKEECSRYNIKTAISPTGTVSRILGVNSGIDPDKDVGYKKELKTMEIAQKYIDGNISKTIVLGKNTTTYDVDKIIRECQNTGIKGITIY